MNLFDKISADIKEAMLARDKVRLEALRGIKKEFLEAKTSKGSNGELEDETALKILQKMVKQRKDSASIYSQNGRADMAETEIQEANVIESYLPKQLTKEEILPIINEELQTLGISDIKMMGRVIGSLQKKLSGRVDGKMLADTVKEILAK